MDGVTDLDTLTPLARIKRYLEMRRTKPLKQSGDIIHGVHGGTEWNAELRLSDLIAAIEGERHDS